MGKTASKITREFVLRGALAGKSMQPFSENLFTEFKVRFRLSGPSGLVKLFVEFLVNERVVV
ncbi:hypothetical protein CH380_09405 [Leptospira adleri]|uniref:Uncharacterized protein n=1 Tax=Leptospira adleri TaxID=2023186 RepID=A0A2M9YPD3_9LEPT|nr:hypothetical protein CH380_09405 [Leptospira adleri]PJZ61848.1 hypothetical protein CH376_11420 [Leptospira adleri]